MKRTALNGHAGVEKMAREKPEWLPAVRAALKVAETYGSPFPGSEILKELARDPGGRGWWPNFRPLVTYGVLEPDGPASRGGHRRYYRVSAPEEVRSALAKVEEGGRLARGRRFSFEGVGRSARGDLSVRAEELLGSEFPPA